MLPRVIKHFVIIFILASSFVHGQSTSDSFLDIEKSYQSLYLDACHSIVGVRGKGAPNPNDSFLLYHSNSSFGTGFLVKPGLIVTSEDVVQGGGDVECTSSDGRTIVGKVIALDSTRGLALIQVPVNDIPILPLEEKFKIGETAFTIGNVYGSITRVNQPAFSMGVVSAFYRPTDGEFRRKVIETDASVNPGSFGGPLLNIHGKVIGVLTPSYSRSRWLGTAIPTKVLLEFLEDFRLGRISPPVSISILPESKEVYLGVELSSSPKTLFKASSIKVTSVIPDSPAADAGIRVGDTILSFGNALIKRTSDLNKATAQYLPGNRVAVILLRGGTKIVRVVILRSKFF